MQRARVGFPLEIDQSAVHACVEIMGSQDESTVQGRSHRPKFPKFLVTERDLLEDKKVARIESESSLQAPSRFVPQALATIHVAG